MSYLSDGKTLTCDGAKGCRESVTHLDSKGYVYCAAHGRDRRTVTRCRKLRPAELRRLQAGEPLSHY